MKKLSSILLCGLMLILSACEKDTESTNFAPVVTTGSASNIYRMGATLSGSIQLTETNTAQSYGILLSSFESMAESTEYPVKDGSTSFNILVQGLEPNETYYYCTYASSGYSIAKSEIKSFTTTQSNPPVFSEIILQSKDEKSCTVSVEILDEGGSDLLISGFVLGESGKGDPTATNNIKIQNVEPQGSRMSATFSGLEPNKTYLVRAYGINASGTGYSNSVSVTTNTATVPFLSDITRVDSTEVSVTVKSAVLDAGLGEVSKYGFCYSSESKEPTTTHLVVENVEGNTDEFTALIENLNPETTYYFRAYAKNEKGVGYSNVIEYTTKQVLTQGTEGDVYVEEAGGLSNFIDENNKYNITKLKVSGYLNGDDIRLIREMAGRDVNGDKTEGKLTDLDISEAVIVEGGDAYYVGYDGEHYTSNDIVGDYMFHDTFLIDILLPHGVVSIGKGAFSNCYSLPNLIIPDGVTSIGSNAFYHCESFQSFTIPNSVTTIGDRSFENCTSLTNISIPNSVTSIGSYAFHRCISLNNIIIPNGITCLNSHIFKDCTSLESISIPNGVTSIYSFAFDNCYALANVSIPNSVTLIDEQAFGGCLSLSSIIIPESVELLGNNTFSNCTSLINVSIPDGIKMKGGIFKYCTSLQNITIPNGITTIPDSFLHGCTSLDNVTIPNDVTSIGGSAFRECSSLKNITIPESVTEIKAYVFKDCTSLANITIPNSVTLINDCAFSGCTSLKSITIPEGVTKISYSTFGGCIALEDVSLPNSLTSIGESAFVYCSSLSNINIPDEVNSIGGGAFMNCTSLTSIDLPESLEGRRMANDVFSGCTSLTSIIIPKNLSYIYGNTFEGCSSLTEVTCMATTPPESNSSNTFRDIASPSTLYVPTGCASAYSSVDPWASSFDVIVEKSFND